MRDLLQTRLSQGALPTTDIANATAPAWMTAAPRGELYIDRRNTANNISSAGGDQVPYPEQFAAIIKAVQSGKPIEGIVEIPDIVVRNPV